MLRSGMKAERSGPVLDKGERARCNPPVAPDRDELKRGPEADAHAEPGTASQKVARLAGLASPSRSVAGRRPGEALQPPAGDAAYVPARLCHAPAGRWSGHPDGSGVAGPRAGGN